MTSFAVRSRTGVLDADYEPGATFGPRRLSDHEFVWLLRGSARWRIEPGGGDRDGGAGDRRGDCQDHGRGDGQDHGRGVEIHDLRPGLLALGCPGQLDRFDWDPERSSRHRFVHFSVTSPGLPVPVGAFPQVRSFDELPLLAALCDHLGELAADPGGRARHRSDELLALLLDLFVDEPTPPERRSGADRRIDPLTPVWEAVAGDWATRGPRIVDVNTMAAAAGMSRGHLFRLFRQRYGCGPARALELVRLARAATALQRSNSSLAVVAAGAGFADAYHFSHRFSAAFGCPPGEFRRRGDSPDPAEPLRAAGLLGVAQRLG